MVSPKYVQSFELCGEARAQAEHASVPDSLEVEDSREPGPDLVEHALADSRAEAFVDRDQEDELQARVCVDDVVRAE